MRFSLCFVRRIATHLAHAHPARQGVTPPEEVQKYIDQRSSMGALGNMNQYMQFQTAQAIRDAANNPGGAGEAQGTGLGAGLGVGMGMAMMDQMRQAMQGGQGQPVPQQGSQQGGPPPQQGYPQQQGGPPPQQNNAPQQGQGAAPTSGPKFCPECGTPVTPGAKFCGNCGHRLVS